jgi:glycosyltransferase involved in cell wall biosynthesis
MYKISIITINYNNKLGLKATIESVLSQTSKNFEFIVIDGNSTDGGKEIIQQYAKQINYCISEPDAGIYNAMNKGIKVAQAEFVIFLNSGDTFFNKKVLEEVEKLITGNHDIYYGDYIQVSRDNTVKITFPEKLTFSFFYLCTLCHQATFIKRKLFEDIFLYNEKYKIASDWEFFVYAICYKNRSYKYLNMTIANFDFTGISSLGKLKHVSKEERIQTIEKYFPAFATDYEFMSDFGLIRIQQIMNIKKYPIALKILKVFIIAISFFIPKMKKNSVLIAEKKVKIPVK